MEKNKFRYGTVDQLPEKIDRKDVTILISVKMEGDLLDTLRARAAVEAKPYQTYMKELLREKLGMSEGDEEMSAQVKKLKEDIEELKAGYRRLAEGRKKLNALKQPRAKRPRAKRAI